MRLTALVECVEHVCCRYRLAAFRPFLEQAGHHLELCPWPRRWCSWLRLERRLRNSDAVIVQRRLPSAWRLHALRRAARLLVFDFDDAIFLRDSYSPKGLHSLRRLQRFAALIESADRVVAGNAFLCEQASRWNAPERIQVIPTCVDPAAYPLAEHGVPPLHPQSLSPAAAVRGEEDGSPSPPLRGRGAGVRGRDTVELVWIGSASTLRGLETLRPVLEMLGQQQAAPPAGSLAQAGSLPGCRLKLVCDRFLSLRYLPVVCCPWSEAGEATALAEADIGISWVPDDLWSRGKCGLKILQYMAAGLPVVANPVGVQAELVRHGETGFLAETPAQWLEAINRLARDPLLRRRFGRVGRQRVEREFSVTAGAARWLGLLQGLQVRRHAA